MSEELSTMYNAAEFEAGVSRRWNEAKAFSAFPDGRENRYVIMMPLPNVTGALHMGHAMDNVMQDLLIRWHRMIGDNTLWMAGTDHAGIATQAVVEKRLKELEGKTRHDIGREALVKRIWEWKDVCQTRIVAQQQSMGCSCDWDRQRFTLDPACARAVSYTFFNLFQDNLIYQGKRLVNWDCVLRTAVSDDEVEHKTVQGHFWHLRYPVIDPKPGEPTHVVVATTRPETMLGDTAVACHPDPEGELDRLIAEAKDEETRTSLLKRKNDHLATLKLLRNMAHDGRKVLLPLQNRPIPLITDTWAKPELGSGCVKVTPAHDPNDYLVWQRHRDSIEIINLLNPDGTFNENAGAFAGRDRYDAREAVVAALDAQSLVEKVEEREIELGHSDRSKTPIEPYLSLQWFVRMGDDPNKVTCGRGTPKEFKADGLAQAAIDAVEDGRLSFHPNPRYGATYVQWLAEKRDWCISRQLWWGHRIPIWSRKVTAADIQEITPKLRRDEREYFALDKIDGSDVASVCLRDPAVDTERVRELEDLGFVRDPDVLDTWFSSAIWPHSTLGWPDPETAQQEPGQPSLSGCLDYYYPGSCLVTGRDIITLWVARMVITGLYNLGDIPFSHVFIHANILDGKGERMSKSKGNGIDPVDIINRYGSDAMRFVLCDMQTGLQDIRLPVQVESPFTGKLLDLHTLKHGASIFTYICPESKKEFDVLGTMPELPSAAPFSSRFEEGQKNCNKIWNAARFAFMNLKGAGFAPLAESDLKAEDRWILSRLAACVADVHRSLLEYNPSAALNMAREFFRGDFCDWYLEIIKPRLQNAADPAAQQILAVCLDQSLRLLHPFIPFITEELWSYFNSLVPQRGVDSPLTITPLLCHATWPKSENARRSEELERRFSFCQEIVREIRNVRAKYGIPPVKPLTANIRATGEHAIMIEEMRHLLTHLGKLGALNIEPEAKHTSDSVTVVIGDIQIFLPGVIDVEKEISRLNTQLEGVQQRIESSKKRLESGDFVTRAKPEIVEQERNKLAEMERQVESIRATLVTFGK